MTLGLAKAVYQGGRQVEVADPGTGPIGVKIRLEPGVVRFIRVAPVDPCLDITVPLGCAVDLGRTTVPLYGPLDWPKTGLLAN